MKKKSEMVPLTNMIYTLLGPDTTLAFRGVKVAIGTWQYCPLLQLPLLCRDMLYSYLVSNSLKCILFPVLFQTQVCKKSNYR